MIDAKQTLADAAKNYVPLKQSCEGSVVSWDWASFAMHHVAPFYAERHLIGPGKKLPAEPVEKTSGIYQYGRDASGQLLVARQYTSSEGRFYEEFFTRRQGVVESVLFHHRATKEVINVCRQDWSDGRIQRFERIAKRGQSVEEYAYEHGMLVSIDLIRSTEVPPKTHRSQDRISYDAIGRLEKIMRFYEQKTPEELIYQRPSPDQSLDRISESIQQSLQSMIPAAIRTAGISGPVYSVILSYSLEDTPSLPPIVSVGLDRQREAWILEKGPNAKGMVWNTPEFEHADLQLVAGNDAAFQAICRLFRQELAINGEWERATELLNSVARSLSKIDWTGVVSVTDDFVVFATDFEGSTFRSNIEAAVEPEKVALLRARGWF